MMTATGHARDAARTSRGGSAGTASALAVVLGAVALVLVAPSAAGGPMNLLYPVVMVLVALVQLRREPAAYFEHTLWVWLLSPFVRRVVDEASGYHENSFVMLAPPLCALVAVLRLWRVRAQVHRDVAVLLGIAVTAIAYAGAVGTLRAGAPAAALASVNLLAPLALGAFVALGPLSRADLKVSLARVAAGGCALLGAYGILQYLVLPSWDEAWMRDSDLSSIGRPRPLEVRVFSTLNTAGPFAQVLTVLTVLLAGSRRIRGPVRAVLVTVALVAIGLSLVRAAWLALLLDVALLVLARRLPLKNVVVTALALGAVLSIGSGTFGAAISERATSTAEAGAGDYSLGERLTFQATIAPRALGDVVGQGLGSTGISTRLAEDSGSADVVRNFDSGVFETIYTLGSIPGLTLLATLLLVTARTWRRAARGPDEDAYVAAALAGLVLALLFTNTLAGVYGVFLWLLVGYSGRAEGAYGRIEA